MILSDVENLENLVLLLSTREKFYNFQGNFKTNSEYEMSSAL